MNVTERWGRNEQVLWRRSGSGIAIKLPDQDHIVALSASGQALWEELAESQTLKQVAAALARRYGVSSEQVEVDLIPVLAELERHRLVVRIAA